MAIEKVSVASAPLESWPIPADQVRSGDPRASGLSLHEGADGAGSGIWECTPGTFDWVYDAHQSLCVVSGEAQVQIEGGPRLQLGPGDAAVFPQGTRATWTVTRTLRKLYTLYR
jgi:uncharacterized cupin superfamily protein